MAQEQAYLVNLQSAASYTISGSGLTLTLTLADETELVYFAAMATPLPAQ